MKEIACCQAGVTAMILGAYFFSFFDGENFSILPFIEGFKATVILTVIALLLPAIVNIGVVCTMVAGAGLLLVSGVFEIIKAPNPLPGLLTLSLIPVVLGYAGMIIQKHIGETRLASQKVFFMFLGQLVGIVIPLALSLIFSL